MKVLTTGVIRPKSHEERNLEADRTEQARLNAYLVNTMFEATVRGGMARVNAAALLSILDRLAAQADAKTAEQLMFEADVLDEYDDQPGARTLFPSDRAGE